MPMDGIMLGFVTRELQETLADARVDRVLQPERDEIHLLLRAGGQNRRLLLSASAGAARAHLSERQRTGPQEPPMFCMLLRKHLSGGRLREIRQIGGDRILSLVFATRNEMGDATERSIVVEMMGRHSNIILLSPEGRIIDAARHITEELSRVRQILPGLPYSLPPTQEKLDPAEANEDALAAHLRTESGPLEKTILHILAGFSPQAARETCARLLLDPEQRTNALNVQELSRALLRWIREIPAQGPPVVTLREDGMPRDVFPFPQEHLSGCETRTYDSPSRALEAFFGERDRQEHMKQRASSLAHLIKSHVSRVEKKIVLQDEALLGAARMEEYRKFGELLQSNAYRLHKGEEARVEDYYEPDCPEIRIPMDGALSPMQNAQRYFKLYRKARGARQLAAEQKEKAERELDFLTQAEDDLRKANSEKDLSELRSLLEDAGFLKRSQGRGKPRKEAPSQSLLYRATDGTSIEVGKNAMQNERLTLSAKGDEYWLHAQKIPGSHVIVHSGSPSEETLREAALLAAWYSRGAGSANVPVDATQRRYVKKPGGTPQGFVTYTHQTTYYVTPVETDVKRLKLERS